MNTLHNLAVSSPFHRFSFEGFPLHMKEYGRGKSKIPLVFIGGAFQNINQIEKLSLAFAEKTWVIAVDTPGNGDTGVLPHQYDFNFICKAIRHGLESLGVDRINLLGCSYGSIIAMKYAQLFPNIDRLVVGAAMAHIPDRIEYIFNLLLFQLKWQKMDDFANGFTDLMTNPELRETNKLCRITGEKLRHALLHANNGMKEQFTHNTLRILQYGETDLTKMPDIETTVFTGEHDSFTPVEDNKTVAKAFKRGRFVSIPNADHMFHVEQFRTTVATILEAAIGHTEQESVAA
ncbi:alpha/beta fold hydrolase [Kordiimonas pumila]|uniref:Alpha/beta fold hydrolase n=1 Tax=Kordiimonas pumila TaxID=2161677 RepID=A0ABV7D1Y1_9PROT|nr:alpha/beta hydrolase [Kordiimonas pumila]